MINYLGGMLQKKMTRLPLYLTENVNADTTLTKSLFKWGEKLSLNMVSLHSEIFSTDADKGENNGKDMEH